ncbi:MAG: hypothetical protein K2G29_08020 [Muribaculaceae bacterium]|nr:hypothetical protein [Muribaculaceae bacterium]
MKTLLINMLSRKAGRNIATPHGCAWLCHDIAARTNESISVNTLKRLTGVIKVYTDNKIHLNGANKDIIARYLGYKEWSDFCSKFQHSASDETGSSVKSDAQGKTKDSAEPIIGIRPSKSYFIRMEVDNMDKKFLGQSA